MPCRVVRLAYRASAVHRSYAGRCKSGSRQTTACRGTRPPLQCHSATGLACLGLCLPQVVLKNMSLVRATVSIKRISAEPEDEAVFAFSPKHVVGRGGVHPSVVSATAVVCATVANTAAPHTASKRGTGA